MSNGRQYVQDEHKLKTLSVRNPLGCSDALKPKCGWSTYICSPRIMAILPVQFRQDIFSDVVLVKTKSLELSELDKNGHLVSISTLQTSVGIRCAAILSSSYNLNRGNDVLNLNNIKSSSDIILCVLQDDTLRVVYYDNTGQTLCFGESISLPNHLKLLGTLGHSILTDLYGRAYCLPYQADQVRLTVFPEDGAVSIEDVTTYIEVEGIITRMTFLHTKGNLVQALVHSVKLNAELSQKAFFSIIESRIEWPPVLTNRVPLPDYLVFPLHILSLKSIYGVLVITESRACIAKISQLVSGDLNFLNVTLGLENDELVSACTTSREDLSLGSEIMYIGTDRGNIYKLTLSSSKVFIEHMYKSVPVGAVLALLPSYFISGDLIFNPGESSDGKLFLLSKHGSAQLISKIEQWIPVLDCKLVTIGAYASHTGSFTLSNAKKLCQDHIMTVDRLFVCCGQGLHGSVKELQVGLRTTDVAKVELDVGKIWRLWSLRIHDKDYIILSMAWEETMMLCLETNQDELLISDVTSCVQIAAYQSSIYCASWDTYIIQVTRLGIYIFQPYSDVCTGWNTANHETIIVATSFKQYIIVAVRLHEVVEIKFVKLSDQVNNIKIESYRLLEGLSQEPTLVHLYEHDLVLYFIMGFRDPSLRAYVISQDTNIFSIKELARLSQFEDEFEIPESIARLEHSECLYFIVGLRNGSLMLILYRDGILYNCDYVRLGLSPVQILEYHVEDGELPVFLAFNGRAWRITVKLSSQSLCLDEILFEDFKQRYIMWASLIPNFDRTVEDLELMFLIDGHLELCKVQMSRSTVSREYMLQETPRRLLYDPFIKHLIVACNDVKVENDDGKITKTATIIVLDPVSGEIRNPLHSGMLCDTETTKPIFLPGEQICSVTNWLITYHGRPYHYTCIGTRNGPNNRSGGRLLVLGIMLVVTEDGSIKLEVRRRLRIVTAAPVYAVQPISPCSLVYSSGQLLQIKELDLETLNFRKRLLTERCRSAIVSMDIKGQYIYVATERDGIAMFEYCCGQRACVEKGPSCLHMRNAESISRACVHIQLSGNQVLVSDMSGTICSLDAETLAVRWRICAETMTIKIIEHSQKFWHDDDSPVFIALGADGTILQFAELEDSVGEYIFENILQTLEQNDLCKVIRNCSIDLKQALEKQLITKPPVTIAKLLRRLQ